MARTEPNTGALVTGGILLGAWAFWVMAGDGDTSWVYGGLLGLALAGGLYAARYASPEARTPIYIAIGLAVGFTLMGIAFSGTFLGIFPGIIGFFVVMLGATSIANGLPRDIPEPDHGN